MSRASETRLGKLEVRAGVAGRRVFIFGAVEPGKAKRRELIASGEATEDDLFIFTGVPDRETRSPMCALPSTHQASGCGSSCPTCARPSVTDELPHGTDLGGLLAAQGARNSSRAWTRLRQ